MRWLLLGFVVAACGGKPPSPATDAPDTTAGAADVPTQTCTQIQDAARNKLAAVLEANVTCTQDSDCIFVGFGAGCFDSCSRVMAATGQPEYDRTVIAIDGAECHEYAQQGCPAAVSPPCTPPLAPHCNAGVCQ